MRMMFLRHLCIFPDRATIRTRQSEVEGGAVTVVKSSSKIPQLDGLRGIAIFLVLIWHFVAFSLIPEPGSIAAYAMDILRLSWSGVDLFFVLSGFLIGGILIDNRLAKN